MWKQTLPYGYFLIHQWVFGQKNNRQAHQLHILSENVKDHKFDLSVHFFIVSEIVAKIIELVEHKASPKIT